MTGGSDILYIIHGSNAHTWWRRLANRGYPWWRRWSLFNCEIRRAFGAECEIREFRWSGQNTHEARMKAGADLAQRIEKEALGRRIHLVGHSHGGNVALAGTNHLPPGSVESLIILANPNMAVINRKGEPPDWLYWGDARERVPHIWNLYCPQDIVQGTLSQWFHGVQGKAVLVSPACGNTDHKSVQNGEIHWKRRFAAHRSMHSGTMGAVVGALLRGEDFGSAMKAAGLSTVERNDVGDRGGWPGIGQTQHLIRKRGDATPFDLGNASGGVGILFVHGFTASPAEMRPMAQSIATHTGWRCKGILLPGHGTRVEDMKGTRGGDWIATVESAYEELARECRHVFLVGLSLGAVLACHLGLRRSHDSKLRGLILLAPAFGLSTMRTAGVYLLRHVYNLRSKGTRAADYFLDHRLYSYLQTPLDRAADVLRLGLQASRSMGKLSHLPVMMFAGDKESSVSRETMLSVAHDNPWIRLVRLPRSRHILTVEPDREMMVEASIRFVEECLTRVIEKT